MPYERAWSGLSTIASKFTENNYFKKAIATNLLYDVFNYSNFEVFKNLINGLRLSEQQIA